MAAGNENDHSGSRQENCQLDFKNFTYPSPFHPNEEIRLSGGKSEPEKGGDGRIVGIGYSYVSTVYGVIAMDGRETAIAGIVIDVITGGSATPKIIYIYEIEQGTPKLLWKFESGDRADGGLRNVSFYNGNIVLATYEAENAEGDCCPKTFSTTSYGWRTGALVELEQKTGLQNPNDSAIFIGKDMSCFELHHK